MAFLKIQELEKLRRFFKMEKCIGCEWNESIFILSKINEKT